MGQKQPSESFQLQMLHIQAVHLSEEQVSILLCKHGMPAMNGMPVPTHASHRMGLPQVMITRLISPVLSILSIRKQPPFNFESMIHKASCHRKKNEGSDGGARVVTVGEYPAERTWGLGGQGFQQQCGGGHQPCGRRLGIHCQYHPSHPICHLQLCTLLSETFG